MKRCPQCHVDFEKITTKRGIYWHCPSCGGIVATIGFLRSNIPDFIVNQIWQKARENSTPGLRTCPSCGKQMVTIEAKTSHAMDELDICKTCQLVWFDKNEYEVYPQKPMEKTIYDYLSPEEREQLALAQMDLDRELLDAQQLQDREKGSLYGFLLSLIFRFFC